MAGPVNAAVLALDEDSTDTEVREALQRTYPVTTEILVTPASKVRISRYYGCFHDVRL